MDSLQEQRFELLQRLEISLPPYQISRMKVDVVENNSLSYQLDEEAFADLVAMFTHAEDMGARPPEVFLKVNVKQGPPSKADQASAQAEKLVTPSPTRGRTGSKLKKKKRTPTRKAPTAIAAAASSGGRGSEFDKVSAEMATRSGERLRGQALEFAELVKKKEKDKQTAERECATVKHQLQQANERAAKRREEDAAREAALIAAAEERAPHVRNVKCNV